MKQLTLLMLTAITACSLNAQTIKGTYAIKNVATGMVLRVKDANKANGTPLVSYTPVNWKCVTWDFKHVEGQTYQLANLFTGKTFQPKEAPAEAVLLEEQPLSTGVANQQYEFLPGDNNSYWIRLKGTELYITPADDKGTTNSGILLAPKKAGALQTWTLQEQHPTM